MKTATCRPPRQVICSAPLGGITPKVATQGWKKIPLVSGQVQGCWPQSARDHLRVGILLRCFQAGPLGSTTEQSLATLLWKKFQGSVVGLFDSVPQ